MSATSAAVRDRRLDLDRAKGLAILLVVFGHIVAQQVPPGVGWYEPLRYLVYRFHMPFFLYLSGTVVVLAGTLATPPQGWRRLAGKRAERLLLPFFALGLLILLGKLAAAQLVFVDNQPQGLLPGLRDLFLTTARSPAITVWYLLVLFLATVVAVPLYRLGLRGNALVALGLLLQLPEVPALLYLDRFASHFLFFAAGVWVAERQSWLLPRFEAWQWLWWPVFGAALGVASLHVLPDNWAMVLCGLACIPALHGAVRCAPIAQLQWPLWLGRYSLAIYLFNTIAIGCAKAALILLGFGWTAHWFALHAAVLMAAGVAGPILFKMLVLRRKRTLDRLTD